MNTFTILDPKTCGKKIDRIAKVGKALQTEIHSVAVSTLSHVREHGDYTLAVRLLNALPNGQRVKALAFWFGHFSDGVLKMSYDKDTQSWTAKLKGERDLIDVAKAAATNYADLSPEKGYSTFTVAAFKAFLKRKANEDGLNPDGSPKVDPKLRGVLADLYAKFESATREAAQSATPSVELDELMPEVEPA